MHKEETMTIKLVGYADEERSLKLLQKAGHSWSCYIQKEPRHQQTAPVYAKFSGPQLKFRENELFTALQMEAALCAWEWMCENRDGALLKEFFEGLGSSAMRHCSMQAGDIALQVHDHMTAQGYEFADAYDWEFVPSVLLKLDWEKLTDDNQYGGEPYRPDIHAIFLAMYAADKSREIDPIRRSFQKTGLQLSEHISMCRLEAEKQWGYDDLVSDHPEKVRQAWLDKTDPAEFIKWLGEKYDLTPKSEMGLAP